MGRRSWRCTATSRTPRCGRPCPETAEVEAAGLRIGVVHDGGPEAGRLEALRRRFPGVGAVVFGHSHIPLLEVGARRLPDPQPGQPDRPAQAAAPQHGRDRGRAGRTPAGHLLGGRRPGGPAAAGPGLLASHGAHRADRPRAAGRRRGAERAVAGHRIPYPILMVIGGLGLGLIPGAPEVVLDPDLVLVVFLPPLLYIGAFFVRCGTCGAMPARSPCSPWGWWWPPRRGRGGRRTI